MHETKPLLDPPSPDAATTASMNPGGEYVALCVLKYDLKVDVGAYFVVLYAGHPCGALRFFCFEAGGLTQVPQARGIVARAL